VCIVCVCVFCVCVWVYVYMRVCVCVCVCGVRALHSMFEAISIMNRYRTGR